MLARTSLLLAVLGACGASAAHPIPIALLELGDRSAIGPVRVEGLEPHEVALPAPATPPEDGVVATLVDVRAAYVDGNFPRCLQLVATIDVAKLLSNEQRASAARALAFDIACAAGTVPTTISDAKAARFASYGLDLPDSLVAPNIEAMIGKAIKTNGTLASVLVTIVAVPGARLLVDGMPLGCASPCTRPFRSGEHVVTASADGFLAASQVVQLTEAATVTIAQPPASAALAAAQWRARTGAQQTDAIAAMLIGRFVPEQRVAVIHGDKQLRAELVVGGTQVAAKIGGDASTVVRELAYDGGVLHRPAVWQRPAFWIAVTGAAIVIAGAIVAVTYTPPTHTGGGF